MTATDLRNTFLTDELLERFDQRAPVHDRHNSFFDDDFEELRACGYLNLAVPVELGGFGLGLDAYSQLAQRLAYVAPATALAVNMHVYWTGVAADLRRAGDDSCAFILEKSIEGEVFAALHGEPGNDMPLMYSTSTAERVDGGWQISGHKIFGSLAPVWTYGGFHAMDTSDPEHPRIVHGFVPRSASGVQVVETWDTLGMRATQSHDIVLDKAFCPDELVPVVCPAGFGGAGPFHVSVFAWGLLGFASVYLGAARRAYDLTLEKLPTRGSIALRNSMAHHPEAQHLVADMRLRLDAAEALLDKTTADWAAGADRADWPVRILSARHTVIGNAYDVVDTALDLSGGAGAFKANRLEQLFRDLRMGRFHPGNTLLAHELIAKMALGIDPDAPLRWG